MWGSFCSQNSLNSALNQELFQSTWICLCIWNVSSKGFFHPLVLLRFCGITSHKLIVSFSLNNHVVWGLRALAFPLPHVIVLPFLIMAPFLKALLAVWHIYTWLHFNSVQTYVQEKNLRKDHIVARALELDTCDFIYILLHVGYKYARP